jgi:hypothetical protein
MKTMKITPMFILMALLIIVAYNVGASNVLKSASAAGVGLSYALTGRNASGSFVGYPA